MVLSIITTYPVVGSNAKPLGLLKSISKIIVQYLRLVSQANIISLVSSKKYQFPLIQSIASW